MAERSGRDRFPLLMIGGLLLFGSLGAFLVRGAQRAEHADVLSSFRASPRGARALYLLGSELGLNVQRYTQDLEQLPETGAFVLLAVESSDAESLVPPKDEDEDEPEEGEERYEGTNRWVPRLSADETTALLAHVSAGNTLVYVPWGVKKDPLLEAVGFSLRPAPSGLGIRTLVPSQPAPFTLDVERVEARVQGWLDYTQHAVPLLTDSHLGETVAAVAPLGAGRIVVIAAPELAMNRALPRADNARLWASLLAASAPLSHDDAGRLQRGAIYLDEYHHGFSEDRSVIHFALRYQLHLAVAQLLLGLCCWAAALRRFGRPRPPPQDQREGGVDALLATSRLYREGNHHAYAAGLIAQGAAQELAPVAGLPATSAPREVIAGLAARGRRDLAASLNEVQAAAAEAHSDRTVEKVARLAARARNRHRKPRS